MAIWRTLSAALLLAFCASNAAAQDSAAALEARGEWLAAIEAGHQTGNAESLTASAKAGLFLAAYGEPDEDKALDYLDTARADAEAATALDPDNMEALLQLAIAEGYGARIRTSPKRGKQSRAKGLAILERDPSNPLALAFIGGWHGEAIASYGTLIASVGIGASLKEFERYFDAALEQAPANPLILAYYTRLLLDINKDGMREKAATLLDNIDSAEPANAFEAYMKDNAIALKAALEAGDKKALKRLIKQQRPLRALK